jgi:hypothetical protein
MCVLHPKSYLSNHKTTSEQPDPGGEGKKKCQTSVPLTVEGELDGERESSAQTSDGDDTNGDLEGEGECWDEGEDATLRSMPSPISLHQRRQDDWQTPPFVQHAAGRRPTTRSSHPAASSNTKAHVQSGPL